MKRILIATANPGKVRTAKVILERLGYEGVRIAEMGLELVEPEETLELAEDIATEKAVGYARQLREMPVLARDDFGSFGVGGCEWGFFVL